MAARPKRVLVGYDGSSSGQRALEAAANLVGYGSTLAVVSVGERSGDDADAWLEDARVRLRDQQLPVTYFPRGGDAADELLQAVEDLGASLLVVGARTQNGHPGPGLGAVSGDVVRRAQCDVLVVR